MEQILQELALDATDMHLLTLIQDDASLSNLAMAQALNLSPPTCLRRVKKLWDSGLIVRQTAWLDADKMAAVLGHGLTAVVEISLDRQDADRLQAFETRIQPEEAVQMCWRVSPGPDFVLVVVVQDMPGYLALAQRLFTTDANVRNVKAFFSLKRAKFKPKVPLTQ